MGLKMPYYVFFLLLSFHLLGAHLSCGYVLTLNGNICSDLFVTKFTIEDRGLFEASVKTTDMLTEN